MTEKEISDYRKKNELKKNTDFIDCLQMDLFEELIESTITWKENKEKNREKFNFLFYFSVNAL